MLSRRETDSEADIESHSRHVSIEANLKRQASDGIAKIARLLNSANHAEEDSENVSHQPKWSKAGGAALKSEAGHVAKKMREAAKLKELQRQPFPIVVARIKHLLERIHKLKSLVARPNSRSTSPTRMHSHVASLMDRRRSSELASIQPSDLYRLMGGTSPEPTAPPISEAHKGLKVSHSRPESPALMFRDADGEGAGHSDPSSPSIHNLEAMVQELNLTFSFVSDFLGRLPADIRTSLAFHGKVENYKKDQDIYMIGDEPSKFFVILTGQVEVWTHPPGKKRHRTHLDTLRKGQIFGDLALLNDEARSECCTPSCNCTFITLDRRAFLQVLGPYFQTKLESDVDFFMSSSEIFSSISIENAKNVINKMLNSTYKAGKEWEPFIEGQIYFVKSGTCILESHDHKVVAQSVTRAMLGGIGDAPSLADEGTLANVVIGADGRAIGTLGHEEEIRKLRRMLIPKKQLTILGPGAVFGGGQTVMGEGEAQATLKVLAQSDVEVFHMHMRLFEEYATPELLRVLRDDFAFKLTYYLGRKGEIGSHQVVGHPDALLQRTAWDSSSDQHNPALSAALASNPAAGLRNLIPLLSTKKKKCVKHVHEPGKNSIEVQKALDHLQALKDGSYYFDPEVQKHYSTLEQQGITSSETFWCSPHASLTNRQATIPPLLSQIFPEGLNPLGDKVEDLVMRTTRKTEEVILSTAAMLVSPKSPSKCFTKPEEADLAGLESASQRLDRMRRLSQATYSAPSSTITSPSSSRQLPGNDRGTISRLSVALPSSPFSGFVSPFDPSRLHSAANATRYSRSKTEDDHPSASIGVGGSGGSPVQPRAASARSRGLALTAAGVTWDKEQSSSTPLHRQCLTFEEMSALRRRGENEAAAEAEEKQRRLLMASVASQPSLAAFSRSSSRNLTPPGILKSTSQKSRAKSQISRVPSVRMPTPLSFSSRFGPDISRMASSSSLSLPPHMQDLVSTQQSQVNAETSRSRF